MSAEQVQECEIESRILSQLNHPNILRFISRSTIKSSYYVSYSLLPYTLSHSFFYRLLGRYTDKSGHQYIVTELANMGNLKGLLKEEKDLIDERQLLSMSIQIAAAMS